MKRGIIRRRWGHLWKVLESPQGPERLQVFNMLTYLLIKQDSPTQPWFGILSECFGYFKSTWYKEQELEASSKLHSNFANYMFQKGVFFFPLSPPFSPRPRMTSRHQMLMKVCLASRAVKWKLKILHHRMALKILGHVEISAVSSSSPAHSATHASGLSLLHQVLRKFS